MHILIPALHRASKPTGICRYAANLAQSLTENTQVTQVTTIIGSWQKHYFEKLISSTKIHLIDVDIKNSSVSRNIWFLSTLAKLSNQLKPDIVHMSFPIPFIQSNFNAPIISTIHDLYPFDYPENFGYPNAWFNQLFLRMCVRNSQGLTCVSQATLKDLKVHFPNLRKPINVIYNVVDFSNINPIHPKEFHGQLNSPFLLLVAQHRKNKNISLLLEAYHHLLLEARSLSPLTRLILVGSPGPETESLCKQIDSLGLQERVLMLSSISDGELKWLFQNCEVFVAPSSTEGFCIPLAEALHFGCRVVCSDIPIFQEVASCNCTYFDLQSAPVRNLSLAISKALKLPRGQILDNKIFSRPYTAQQYLELYAKILH